MKGFYTAAFMADQHLQAGELPHPAWKVAKAFLKEMQPNYVILGGDFGNFQCLSHWDKKRPLLMEGQRYAYDMIVLNRELDELQDVCPRSSFIFMEGNHEAWGIRMVEENPSLLGTVDIQRDLRIDDRSMKWIPNNGVYTLGRMNFLHGWYWNKYHAQRTLAEMGDNAMYGHVHNHQVAIQRIRARRQPHIAMAVGCLCDLNPHFLRNKPNQWLHGFGFVEFVPSGNFQAHHIVVIEGQAIFGGKVFAPILEAKRKRT